MRTYRGFDTVSSGGRAENGDVPCRDGVSTFHDDVDAMGEVGRVYDEAVLECEGLVWRAHNGVAGIYSSPTNCREGHVRTFDSSAVEGIYDHMKGARLASAPQEGRLVRAGMDLPGGSMLVTIYRKTTSMGESGFVLTCLVGSLLLQSCFDEQSRTTYLPSGSDYVIMSTNY